MTCYYQFCYRM